MPDTNVKKIIFNKLTKEKYDSTTINPNEFYIITDYPEPLTQTEADTLYTPIRKSVTDTSSTTITLANADANTVYHYGTLDSLTITAADISDLETIIWFTPTASLTGVTIPETLQPMNTFNPVAGKLCCLSILNGTIVYGSIL